MNGGVINFKVNFVFVGVAQFELSNHTDANNVSISELNIVTVISTFADIYYTYKISLIITILDVLLVKNLWKKNNCVLNAVYGCI